MLWLNYALASSGSLLDKSKIKHKALRERMKVDFSQDFQKRCIQVTVFNSNEIFIDRYSPQVP